MIRRFLLWTGGATLIALLLAFVGVAWLLTTEHGARWLLGQSSPYLPQALSIESVNGSLLKGLQFRSVGWNDGTAGVAVAELDTEVELLALFKREVRISGLTIRNVDVQIAERPAKTDDSGPVAVDIPIVLRIDNASIEGARLAFAGNDIAIREIRLDGQLSGSDLTIDRLELHSELGDIGLSGSAQLSGNYPARANVAWELRLPDQLPVSGILKLQGELSRYEIESDLDAPYEIATRGTVALLDTGVELDLDNTWQRVRIEQGDAPIIEATDGKLRIEGTVGSLNFDAATAVSSVDFPGTALQARGQIGDDRVEFETLSAANEWGRLLASGTFIFSPAPRWTFNVALSELDPAVLDARLGGRLAMVGVTAGSLIDQQPAVSLTLESISGDINQYPVDGRGKFSYAKQRLQFDDTVFRIGDNRLDFAGSYGPRLQVTAKARFPALGQLGLGIAGTLQSDFQFAADSAAFTASGNLVGGSLSWGDYEIETLEADFDLPATGNGAVSLRMNSAEQDSLRAEIDGRFVAEQWFGALRSLTLQRQPIGEWTLQESADFSLSRSSLSLQKACLATAATAGEICVALDYDFSGPLSFDATVNALPLAALPRSLPEGATILGEIVAQARGEFVDGRLNSSAKVRIDGLGLLTSFEGDEVSALFETASASANVIDNRLTGEFDFRLDNGTDYASGTIELDDLFDQRSALLGQGSLELDDLTLFSFFFPDVANPVGRIVGRIDAAGSLAAPEIKGEIALRDGSVDIRRAGISVTEIGLLLRQTRAGELALQGSAKSGDGYLQISGETLLAAESGIRSEIRLDGEDFRLLRLPDWQLTASPTIAILVDERETRISGELGIPEANIMIQTVPESTEKPSQDVVVHRGDAPTPAPQRMLYVDVTTKLGEKVSFSGFGLTTRLDGSVRITGDSRSPYKSQGRVVLREGRYEAYGQNLEIENGELIFNGPLNSPALNVRATRTASDTTVAGIHLTGTPAQLSSEVYSEPPLGDAEALSYLLTGRPLTAANSAEGDMLNQAAFALGLTSAGSIVSRIQNELGLDTFGFQGSAEDRQFFAGKQLNSRLFVEYAYGVVDSLGTLLLRYQLSRRIMVESRSGTVRIVDVVYSVKKP